MAEWDTGAQALAPPAAAMAPRHVGAGPGLVDEHQPLGIEVELAVEPLLAPLQGVGAILLGRVSRLLLRVIPCRTKKRHTVAMLTLTPCSASISRNSASVGSGCCLIAPRMKDACSSIFAVRRFPPCGLAAGVR